MSESFDWLSFLESVEALFNFMSASGHDTRFFIQTSRKTNSMRKVIGASVTSGVDASVSENIQGNVKLLVGNVIQHLIDNVERQLQQLTLPFIALQYFRKLSCVVMVRLGDLSLSLT